MRRVRDTFSNYSEKFSLNSESPSPATALPAGGIVWQWGNIFDTANLDAGPGESAESALGTLRWKALGVATLTAELDVKTVNAEILETSGDGLSGKHGGVRGGLITHGTNHHTTGDLDKSFGAGEIGDMDECVVLGGVDVGNTKALLVAPLCWADISILLLGLLRWSSLLGLRRWIRHAKGPAKPL